jgi:AbiV family abortive infection protein
MPPSQQTPGSLWTPKEIEQLFTAEELVALCKRAWEAGESEPAGPERPILDEFMILSAEKRKRIAEDDRKGAIAGLLARIIHNVASPRSWRVSSLRHMSQPRLRSFVAVASELWKQNPSLLEGKSREEHEASFARIARHLEGIWTDAALLHREKRFPRACALAITCLEEAGKASTSRLQMKAEEVYGPLDENESPEPERPNPFFEHVSKHLLAATVGIVFNPRLDELFGADVVDAALGLMESGELEQLRRRCLYVGFADGRPTFPETQVDRDLSRQWVIIAGEVLVEVAGYPEGERERLLKVVQEFEASA